MIERKINLESFKSRVTGLGRYIGQLSGMTSSGNWGKFPYAIEFSRMDGSTEQLYLKKDNVDSYYKYKGTMDEMSSSVTYYYKSINGEYIEYQTYINENYSLISYLNITSYRDMMDIFYKIEKVYKNTKFYKRFRKNGESKWIEYEPFILEYTNVNIYDSFNDASSAETSIGIYTGDIISQLKSKGTFLLSNAAYESLFDIEDIVDVWENLGGNYNVFMRQYYNFMMRYFGYIKVPDSLIEEENKVPLMISVSGIKEYINNLERYRKSNDCCINQKYEEYGGAKMKEFLENVSEKAEEDEKTFFNLTNARSGSSETDYSLIDATDEYYDFIPKVSIPVLLTKDSDSSGIDDVTQEVVRKTYTGNIRKVQEWTSYEDEDTDETVFVEISATTENGKLYTLRNSRKTYDDDGNELSFNILNFRNNYGKVSFDTGDIFTSGQPMNIKTVVNDSGETIGTYGDIITEINFDTPTEGVAEFHYAINAKLVKSTVGGYWEPDYYDINGIYYIETIPYAEEDFDIEYEGVQISGTARTFSVTYPNNAEMSFLVKKYPFYSETISYNSDTFFGVYETPTISSDVSIDKGSASAFELHMKLGEINTFEDLKNYHNNEFGL